MLERALALTKSLARRSSGFRHMSVFRIARATHRMQMASGFATQCGLACLRADALEQDEFQMQIRVRQYTRPRINKRSHEAPREHQNRLGLHPGGSALNYGAYMRVRSLPELITVVFAEAKS